MGLIDRAIAVLWSPEKRSMPQWLIDWSNGITGEQSAAGVNVTYERAIGISAVLACVRVIAETVASLPLKVYEVKEDGGKDEARNLPAYRLLHDSPNPAMNSMSVRETITAYAVTRGNGYAELARNGRGEVAEIWPLNADRVTPEFADDGRTLLYRLKYDNKEDRTLSADRVLHVPGLGFDGVSGLSVIGAAKDALGLSIAAEQYGSEFFANGSTPGGVLEHPGSLSLEAQKNLQRTWEAAHSGEGNRQRIAVLMEGMKFSAMTIPPEDAQFLETRKFQVNEIARLFRIPPHMIGDLDKATFSNIEHQGLEFVTHTLRPWLVRWEQELNRKMFTQAQRGRYFAEHSIDGLLRGDIASRYSAYATGRNWGWLSVNDIRKRENLNPIPEGDGYLQPLNMTDLGAAPGDAGQGAPGAADEGQRALLPVLVDAFDRLVREECDALERHAGKPEKIEAFYAKHEQRVRDVLRPALKALGGDVDECATNYVAEARREVARAIECGDLPQLVNIWRTEKPQALADSLLGDKA